MNKNEFLFQLRKKLKQLPASEIETAVGYYEEYFMDAGAENEQKVLSELGSPAAVASKIIGEYIVSDSSKGKGLKWLWIVVLAIFASPIALPVAFAFVVVLLSLIITVFAVLFSFVVAGLSVAASGLAAIVAGAALLSSDFASALFFFGTGLVGIPLGIAAIIGFCKLSAVTALGIKKLIGKALIRRSQK